MSAPWKRKLWRGLGSQLDLSSAALDRLWSGGEWAGGPLQDAMGAGWACGLQFATPQKGGRGGPAVAQAAAAAAETPEVPAPSPSPST